MEIKFDVFWPKNLGTLYKENSIDTMGKDGFVDLDLNEVYGIIARFKVGGNSYDDAVQIVDVEKGQIRIPFKSDVIKRGANKLELIAAMKNGDVKPSQTYIYEIEESLENPNGIEAETNYPILISLLQEVGSKIEAVDDVIVRANEAIDGIDDVIEECKDEISKDLEDRFIEYKEDTDRVLEDKFEAYTNSAIESIDNKISEVNELMSNVEASESDREERHNAKIAELNSYSSDVNALKQNISTNTKDIEDLKVNVEDNTSKINQISNAVDNHEDRIKTNEKYTRTHDILVNALFDNSCNESITLNNQEGAIISLPQSKDGVVEIKELQGNTMVNYCTDGKKELTQKEVAEMLGISQSYISRIEKKIINKLKIQNR